MPYLLYINKNRPSELYKTRKMYDNIAMDPILIAVIVILCQYPVAMLTLMFMFNRRYEKSATITWNIVIIGVPFLGAAAFWLFYLIKGRKIPKKPYSQFLKPEEKSPERAEENDVFLQGSADEISEKGDETE